MDFYQPIISDLKKQYEKNKNVLAMFVTGSVARGEAVEGNGLDVLLVTTGEKLSKEYRVGATLVEIGACTIPQALEGMEKNPMKVYLYMDAIAIFDKGDYLSILKDKAQKVLANYKSSTEEKKAMKK